MDCRIVLFPARVKISKNPGNAGDLPAILSSRGSLAHFLVRALKKSKVNKSPIKNEFIFSRQSKNNKV